MRSSEMLLRSQTRRKCGRRVTELEARGTVGMMVSTHQNPASSPRWGSIDLDGTAMGNKPLGIGTCKACNRGLFQMCKNEAINGVTRDGGYGEYVTLRREAVVRVPREVD